MQAIKVQAGIVALSIVVLLMTACGGGGGGGTTTGTTTVLSAYVANYGDGTISQYTINPSTGTLTPKTPATVPSIVGNAMSLPTSIAVNPNGKYAYVANSSAGISQFTIGPGGVLQSMNPATISSGTSGYSPTSVAVDPSGKYLYAVNSAGSEVAQFTIDPANGTLTSMSTPTVCTFSPPSIPCALHSSVYAYITVDPTGNYVYVADQGNDQVEQFSIGVNGGLSPIGTGSISTVANSNPISIGFDPAGKYAYVVNYGDGTISQYTINPSTGALAFASTVTPTLLNNATSIVIDRSGMYAYVANGSGLYQLPIDSSNGSLNAGTGVAPIATGGTTPQSVAIDPSGKFVYVANQYGTTAPNGSVSQFNVGSGFTYAQDVPAGNQAYFITTAVLKL